jgi:hypothetical protein
MKFFPLFNGCVSACLLTATMFSSNTLAQTPFATGPQSNAVAVAPNAPRLEFVYEAKVRLGEFTAMGKYQGQFERGALQLLGGTFEGPNIRGKILPSSKDWPVYYGNGVRSTDVNYVFVTDDGAHLFVTANGFRYDLPRMTGVLAESEQVQPAANLLRVMVQIQAPENSKYAWLNYNLFVGVAGQSAPGPDRTAVLRVYRVL